MRNLVIANSGKEKQGKSTSIREVFNQLSVLYPSTVIIDDGDIKATIMIGDVLVGIESQGDPYSRMQQSMDDFVAMGCNVIVAACRTKWGTYDKITELNTTHSYDIIWAANDKTDISSSHRDILNDRYAKRVILLIMDRIAGVI